jgi:hypothetical protein
MMKTLGVVGLAALMAAPAIRSAIPADAHRSGSPRIGVAILHRAERTKVPSIDIVGTGLGAHFKPNTVTAGLSPTGEACTGSDDSLTMTNKSSLDEDVIEGTSDFVNLPSGATAAVCLYANGSSSFVFGLANANTDNTVVVTVS